jgi:activating signal cointegrator 1
MKALSLMQPWATLLICGEKTVETRSWRTSHRGLLAVHASKTFPLQ